FGGGGKSTEFQTSILQALSLMNGALVTDATTLDRSETLAAVADNPFMTTRERVETLYLATLSRMPTAKEAERRVKYIDNAAGKGENKADKEKLRSEALADVFWALLNSGEFILNH